MTRECSKTRRSRSDGTLIPGTAYERLKTSFVRRSDGASQKRSLSRSTRPGHFPPDGRAGGCRTHFVVLPPPAEDGYQHHCVASGNAGMLPIDECGRGSARVPVVLKGGPRLSPGPGPGEPPPISAPTI